MLVGDGERYVRVAFQNEAELEQVAVSALPLRFGPAAVFLPKAKLGALGSNGTVPDGVVIDLAARAWYLLAVERARYGLWEDIAPRVARQVAAQAREETRHQLLNLALDEIAQSGSLKHALQELEIDERRVHWTLHGILREPPRVALSIDEIPPDLDAWTRTLNTTVQVWRLDKYAESRTGRVLYALPDEGVPPPDASRSAGVIREAEFLQVPPPEPAVRVKEISEPAFLPGPKLDASGGAEERPEPELLQQARWGYP